MPKCLTSGGVVLGGKRVGCAERHLGAALLEGAHEVGGFGGDVQAGADAHAFERAFFREALADGCEHGHVAIRPEDTVEPCVREGDIFNIVVHSNLLHQDRGYHAVGSLLRVATAFPAYGARDSVESICRPGGD